MDEFVSKSSIIKTIEETPFTMSMCLTVDECNGMNRARKIFAELFKMLPAADAEEVCHCDSCENWETDWDSATGDNVHFCPIVTKMTPPYWFCADGEPRENESVFL